MDGGITSNFLASITEVLSLKRRHSFSTQDFSLTSTVCIRQRLIDGTSHDEMATSYDFLIHVTWAFCLMDVHG